MDAEEKRFGDIVVSKSWTKVTITELKAFIGSREEMSMLTVNNKKKE